MLLPMIACGWRGPKPNTDYDEAVSNLERNGYEVWADDEGFYVMEEFLEMIYLGDFKSRPMSSYEDDMTEIPIKSALTSTSDESEELEAIFIFYFKSASDARKCYRKEGIKDAFEELAGEYEEMFDKKFYYGISGNMVWIGTKDAIKATH